MLQQRGVVIAFSSCWFAFSIQRKCMLLKIIPVILFSIVQKSDGQERSDGQEQLASDQAATADSRNAPGKHYFGHTIIL